MYVDGKLIWQCSNAAVSFASTGIKGFLSVPFPVRLRAIVISITTQMTVTAPVLTPKYRPTAGSASGETALSTVTVPIASVAGKVIYKKGYNQLLKPGEHIAFDVTTAATAGAGDISAVLDPQWEELVNNAQATASV